MEGVFFLSVFPDLCHLRHLWIILFVLAFYVITSAVMLDAAAA
jgi:hypothetical protein